MIALIPILPLIERLFNCFMNIPYYFNPFYFSNLVLVLRSSLKINNFLFYNDFKLIKLIMNKKITSFLPQKLMGL